MSEREFEAVTREERSAVDTALRGYVDELHRTLEEARAVMPETSLQRERLSERFARRARIEGGRPRLDRAPRTG